MARVRERRSHHVGMRAIMCFGGSIRNMIARIVVWQQTANVIASSAIWDRFRCFVHAFRCDFASMLMSLYEWLQLPDFHVGSILFFLRCERLLRTHNVSPKINIYVWNVPSGRRPLGRQSNCAHERFPQTRIREFRTRTKIGTQVSCICPILILITIIISCVHPRIHRIPDESVQADGMHAD